jgi:hypothetical protein
MNKLVCGVHGQISVGMWDNTDGCNINMDIDIHSPFPSTYKLKFPFACLCCNFKVTLYSCTWYDNGSRLPPGYRLRRLLTGCRPFSGSLAFSAACKDMSGQIEDSQPTTWTHPLGAQHSRSLSATYLISLSPILKWSP